MIPPEQVANVILKMARTTPSVEEALAKALVTDSLERFNVQWVPAQLRNEEGYAQASGWVEFSHAGSELERLTWAELTQRVDKAVEEALGPIRYTGVVEFIFRRYDRFAHSIAATGWGFVFIYLPEAPKA